MSLPSVTVAPMLFRKCLQEANSKGLKDTTRRIVTRKNSKLSAGSFDDLRLEVTGRGGRNGELRAQCVCDNARVRVVSVTAAAKLGHLFWVKTGRFGSRKQSRQTIEILQVIGRRLQDMGEQDAIREGMQCIPAKFKTGTTKARDWFARYWDDINPDNPWRSNPWVWVYLYRVHAMNVDELLAARGQIDVAQKKTGKKHAHA